MPARFVNEQRIIKAEIYFSFEYNNFNEKRETTTALFPLVLQHIQTPVLNIHPPACPAKMQTGRGVSLYG
ncbi:MAG: hypothetical protein AMS27_05135 [Bacteroides sp. SM23_62_1]|nr:MAG: hypothetical protein AMS27_05135 [Bacteroides sp. SM23_62_1]